MSAAAHSEGGEQTKMTDKEHKATQIETIYEFRLIFKSSDKEHYTKQEILELLDTIAEAKVQE